MKPRPRDVDHHPPEAETPTPEAETPPPEPEAPVAEAETPVAEAEAPALTAERPLANASSRQLAKNFATSYLGLVVSMLLSFFLTPVALHILGPTRYGAWITITNLGSYFSLLGAGVSTAAVQQIATAIARRDEPRQREILATSRGFFVVSGVTALALTVVLAPLLSDVFGFKGSARPTAEVCFILMGVLTCANLLNSVPAVALYGAGRNDRQSLISLATAVTTQGAQLITVALGGGLIGLFIAGAAGAAAGFVATEMTARRTGVLNRVRGHATWPMLRGLLRSGRRNVAVSVAGTVSYSLDAVTIGAILPLRQVAPYDVALSASNFNQSFSTAGTTVLLPAYAHSEALLDRERQFNLFSRAVLISMSISIPIVVALATFGESLLDLWLGKVPHHTYEILVALDIVIALQLPGLQAFGYLIGIGRSGLVAKIALPAAISNLGLSIVGTYLFGPIGPALGSLPQVVILELIVLPIVACRTLEVPARRYAREAMAPLLVPLATALAVALVLRLGVQRTTGLTAPFECVAVTVAAWGSLVPVLLKNDPKLRTSLRNLRAGRGRGPR